MIPVPTPLDTWHSRHRLRVAVSVVLATAMALTPALSGVAGTCCCEGVCAAGAKLTAAEVPKCCSSSKPCGCCQGGGSEPLPDSATGCPACECDGCPCDEVPHRPAGAPPETSSDLSPTVIASFAPTQAAIGLTPIAATFSGWTLQRHACPGPTLRTLFCVWVI